MSSIDQRIVQMRFDNAGFQNGVNNTLNSLKKLHESLKMKGSSKGLEDVGRGISKLNSSGMSGLSSGVDTVTAKFSNMGVIAATALSNITNKAVNAGLSLAKSLTIDPVMDGFHEYETKMGAITTILSNTSHLGTNLEDVNAVLGELNTYADKTIYNFAEMTRNIGTFTAAGVGLEDSASAIKGIANLAAASGSSSAQASSAMYQLSQALATGRVSLMDWNSVVNAGMGGKLFQDALIRTSEHLGTGAKAAIEKYGSFRESLTNGEWLTGDVLIETLKQIAGEYDVAALKAQGYSDAEAQAIVKLADTATAAATEVKTVTQLIDTMKEAVGSGFANAWEWIIGDSKQATKTLTSISEGFNGIIQPFFDFLNGTKDEKGNVITKGLLGGWADGGGRDAIIKGFGNIFSSIGGIAKTFGSAFTDVFGVLKPEHLINISKGFQKFTENFKLSGKAASQLKDIFKGVFTVIKTIGSGALKVVQGIGKVFSSGLFKGLGSMFLSAGSGIGKFITSIGEGIDKCKLFETVSSGIGKAFDKVGEFVGKAADKVKNFFSDLDFSTITNFVSTIGEGIGTAFETIGNVINSIGSGLGKMFGSIDLGSILGVLGGLLSLKGIKKLKDIFKPVGDAIENFGDVLDKFKEIGDKVVDILDGVRGALQAYQNNLNASMLLKVAAAVGLLAVSLKLLSGLNPNELATGLVGIGGALAGLVLAFQAILKIMDGNNMKGITKAATAMILLSAAVGILALALKSISSLNPDELATGLVGVAAALTGLVLASKYIDKESKGMIKASLGLILLATALNIMAGAVRSMASMNWEQLATGLVGVGGALLMLGIFSKQLDSTKILATSIAMIALATALNIMAGAVRSMASMSWEQLATGLVGVGVALAELGIFAKLLSDNGSLLTTSIALIAISAALNILAGAVRSMASMSWEQLAVGLTGLAGGLILVGAAAKLIPGPALLLTAVGLIAMSGALYLMAGAIQKMAEMSWSELAIGLTGLAGALIILGLAGSSMAGCLVGSIAMIAMAGALQLLVPALVQLSEIDPAGVATGLITLAGAMLVLGVAGTAMSGCLLGAVAMIAMAGAIRILAPALQQLSELDPAGAATGIITLAGAMLVLGAAGTAMSGCLLGAVAMIAMAGAIRILAPALQQLSELDPAGAATGIITLAGAMLVLGVAGTAMSGCLLGAVAMIAMAGALRLLVPALEQLSQLSTGEVATNLITLAGSFAVIGGAGLLLTPAIPGILGLAAGLLVLNLACASIGNSFDSVGAGLSKLASDCSSAAPQIKSGVDDIKNALSKLNDIKGGNFANSIGTSLKNAARDISSASKTITSSIQSLVTSCTTKLKGASSQFSSATKSWGSSMSNGFKGASTSVTAAVNSVISSAVNRIRSAGTQFSAAARSWATSIANGFRGGSSALTSNLNSLISKCVSQLRSGGSKFSAAGKQWARNLASGFRSGSAGIASAVRSSISSGVSAARAGASGFRAAGAAMASGMRAGIMSQAASVAAAARAMVANAVSAAKSAAKIHSPSRVFMEMGRYMDEGLAIGLTKYAGIATKEAVAVSEGTINAVSNTLRRISDKLMDNVDSQPVIRPVVDLSNVEEGSRTIGSLMNTAGTIGMSSRALSNNIGRIQNGVTNGDVVSAIKDLQSQIANTGNTTYQINGITYDDGSNISNAVETLVRAARMERRI